MRGTSGVALASGVYWYLKYFCNTSVTWGENGSGDNLVRLRSHLRFRSFFAVCNQLIQLTNHLPFFPEASRVAAPHHAGARHESARTLALLHECLHSLLLVRLVGLGALGARDRLVTKQGEQWRDH